LHYLPFAALLDEQGYLGASYTFFYLPSVSALQFVKQNRKAGGADRMLALAQGTADGLPFLQYARTTTEEIAKLYNAKALTNNEATELALRANASTSNILFLAAHGKLNTASPLFSNIVLSPDKDNDGSLEVHEVYGLDLGRTNLVVLSACQTQLGRGGAGDDLVGLNRAFIYAGAPTVIASLWSVPERQTGELMLSFFRHLKGGSSKAAALSAAQAEVRKERPNPYYWAAFILTGDAGTAGR
jgi:CHAT domain-containing protein